MTLVTLAMLQCRMYEREGRGRRRTFFPSRTCSLSITALTLAIESNVMKANPLDVPVSESRIMLQCVTLPYCSKYVRNPSARSNVFSISVPILATAKDQHLPSVVSQFNPPMNILLIDHQSQRPKREATKTSRGMRVREDEEGRKKGGKERID